MEKGVEGLPLQYPLLGVELANLAVGAVELTVTVVNLEKLVEVAYEAEM